MKLKLDQKVLNLDGEVMKDEKGVQLTVRSVLINALVTPAVEKGAQGMQQEILAPKEKFERYELARKIKNAKGEIESVAEEVVKLKAVVGKLYTSPLLVGFIYNVLDGKENVEAVTEATEEVIAEVEAVDPVTEPVVEAV